MALRGRSRALVHRLIWAGTVGLMMCHVMGVRDEAATRNAVHLGIAMQLTNICRDVAEDWDLREQRGQGRESGAQQAALVADQEQRRTGCPFAGLQLLPSESLELLGPGFGVRRRLEGDTGEAEVDTGSLTFDAGNWDTGLDRKSVV